MTDKELIEMTKDVIDGAQQMLLHLRDMVDTGELDHAGTCEIGNLAAVITYIIYEALHSRFRRMH